MGGQGSVNRCQALYVCWVRYSLAASQLLADPKLFCWGPSCVSWCEETPDHSSWFLCSDTQSRVDGTSHTRVHLLGSQDLVQQLSRQIQ